MAKIGFGDLSARKTSLIEDLPRPKQQSLHDCEEVPLQLANYGAGAVAPAAAMSWLAPSTSGVAVAAEVEEAGAAALGAHVGALGHHEVHEAGAAPGRHEHVPGAEAAAIVAGAGLVGGGEGRERGRDGRAPAAARAAGAAARGAAALSLVLVILAVLFFLVLVLVLFLLVVVVVAAVVAGDGAPPRAGDVHAHGRHGGVAGRRGGRAAGAPGRRRRRARRRRGEGRRRARVHRRAGAVLPVDVVHLPRLHKSAQIYTYIHHKSAKKMQECTGLLALGLQEYASTHLGSLQEQLMLQPQPK